MIEIIFPRNWDWSQISAWLISREMLDGYWDYHRRNYNPVWTVG